jgi:hypothetical protein
LRNCPIGSRSLSVVACEVDDRFIDVPDAPAASFTIRVLLHGDERLGEIGEAVKATATTLWT